MRRLPRPGLAVAVPCWLMLLGGVTVLAGQPEESGGEFAVDQHTLLLAHFNGDTRRADYATAIQEFAGCGAHLVEGYYGKAVDLCFPQFREDFLNTCDDYTPRFQNFGFYERGNVDYRQGTIEFWLRIMQPGKTITPSYGGTFKAYLGRNVIKPGDKQFSSFYLNLSQSRFDYLFPLLAGDYFQGQVDFTRLPGFERKLEPTDWHHVALCWSPGEIVVWLDGRPLASHDMTGKFGFAPTSNPVRFLSFADCILDELRISRVVRYAEDFEPRWVDGQRPAHAFPGNPQVKRVPMKHEPPYVPGVVDAPEGTETIEATLGAVGCHFDRATGYLTGLAVGDRSAVRGAGGVMLWEGLQRAWLPARKADEWNPGENMLSFRQEFAGRVEVVHELMGSGGIVRWDVRLENLADEEIWLELLLGVPLPFSAVDDYFDGTSRKTELMVPRRKETPASTLPLVAASGEGLGVGVGVDPHLCLHSIPCEWIPEALGGTIRVGTKVALAPGERYAYTFFLVTTGRTDFGAMDVVDRFHGLFPDLYRLRPDVPIYSYMPTDEYVAANPFVDQKRICYIGGFWGHGPGHSKGDEYGSPRFWNNRKYEGRLSYEYCKNIEKAWGTLENLHRLHMAYSRRSFDNYYPLRRSHVCPDLTPGHLIEDLWPDYRPDNDPLCCGQYYSPHADLWLVNEYDTPLGRYFVDQTLKVYDKKKGFSPGWINDMSHVPLMRASDPAAKRTPGRAFSRDRGTYVLRTLGRQARYEVINDQVHRGRRTSIWSDGGSFSYTLCAFSAATAVEGGVLYRDLTSNGDTLAVARVLLGEKPITVKNHFASDNQIGRYHSPDEFTPRSLRDYHRYLDAQLTLFAIKHGITLDSSYLTGRQESMERVPIMVESTVLGRKLLSGARVEEPLWVVRAGNGGESFLVVGNEKPQPLRTDLPLIDPYFGGSPLLAPYYGGQVRHRIGGGSTTIADVEVDPRGLQAFKAIGLLHASGDAQATTSFSGDGITVDVEITVQSDQPAQLELNTFAPMYRAGSVTVDGKPVDYHPGGQLPIESGRHVIKARYANRALAFARDDWDAVDLIQDGRTNFCLVADPGFTFSANGRAFDFGFERGTAMMLNEFLEFYDQEDGRGGTLQPAPFVDRTPEGFEGWTVIFGEDPEIPHGRVRIERAGKTLRVEGPTQGEIRRAMVVLMRLVDRKYPHVGRFLPPVDARKQWYLDQGKTPWEVWQMRGGTETFYAQFEDKRWLVKPILRPEYESLYENDNLDFADKYELRWSPYLFEPTYAEGFVYGYDGPAAMPVAVDTGDVAE